jgi:hypothetical protein
MKVPQPADFEVRLIVWETFDIPKSPSKSVVDIFIKAAMDSTATGTNEEVCKETDTHCGSEDGKGIFNYRLTFPF